MFRIYVVKQEVGKCRKNNLLQRFTTICCRALDGKYVNGRCTAKKKSKNTTPNKLQLSCFRIERRKSYHVLLIRGVADTGHCDVMFSYK